MDKDNKKYTVEENVQIDFELVSSEDLNTNNKGQKMKENLKKIDCDTRKEVYKLEQLILDDEVADVKIYKGKKESWQRFN